MKEFLKKLPEQAVRVIVVFVVLAAGMLVVRQFIIPPEMKEMPLIHTATMEREANKEIKYAGAAICSQCHEKQQEMKQDRLPSGSFLRVLSRRRAKTRR